MLVVQTWTPQMQSAIAVMSKGHICSLCHHALASASLRIRETPIRADFHMPMATGQSTSFQSRLALL